MKNHEAIQKLKSEIPDVREDGIWALYVNAMHCYKTLEHRAKNEQDWKLRDLLNKMLNDFKVLHDKENS
jgi:hypothetical protein